MIWSAAFLVIIAVMASVLGLAGSGHSAASALTTLFYLFVTVFAYSFFFLLRPTRHRQGPLGRRTHSRHERT